MSFVSFLSRNQSSFSLFKRKKGLFNIITNNLDITSLATCDLFGGTGSITYELASRGAKDCTIVEKDPAMFDYIVKTSKELKLENIHAVKMDVFRFISQCKEKFDLIFAGPPYALNIIDEIPKIVIEKNLIAEDGFFVLEHTPRNDYEKYKGFNFKRNYGTTVFSFFIPTI